MDDAGPYFTATSALLLSAMFGGFLVNIDSVAPGLRWLQVRTASNCTRFCT